MAFAREAGFGALAERGVAAAEGIGPDVVYAGFSFGVMIAQQLAQTRPGARGALLMYGCLPVSEFGDAWPEGVPVQVHGKEDDPFFAEDLEAAQALVESTEGELFLYREGRASATPHSRSTTRRRRSCAELFLYAGSNTSSPTRRSRRTTPRPRHCSSSACWSSSTRFRPTVGRRSPSSDLWFPAAATGVASRPRQARDPRLLDSTRALYHFSPATAPSMTTRRSSRKSRCAAIRWRSLSPRRCEASACFAAQRAASTPVHVTMLKEICLLIADPEDPITQGACLQVAVGQSHVYDPQRNPYETLTG